MFYCNREHQAAHTSSHKSACNAFAKRRDILDAEEQKLRSHPGDMFTPADVFTNSVGHFWGILETRDYMRARFALVEALGKVKTYDAVQAQLDHVVDMLRLCRSDNMGVRDLVPPLMLRLNKDQECYDFVKWYSTTGEQGDYDWGNMDLPYLDVRNADVFESVEYLCGNYINLSFTVGITLLKIKLLLGLTALRDSAVVGKKVPREILDSIQAYVPQSPIIAGNRDIMKRGDHAAAIDELTAQVDMLYKAVKRANKYFWPSLLEPGEHLAARPQAYSHGGMEQMQLVLQYSYDSWIETPGAIEVIKAKEEHS
ncbi:hypothetical protein GP486_001905 [Trichoglossum hirsutum]|uniref:Suppressor of anucleate metulae protein B n=1 Tax=Trichoglossum hirsutum TaxID=265104 RepID=A0A9P8LFY6_9PEZI|nr:hypothetical protein GP486_001905 [Trichoglossum hirsutum]